MIRPLSDETCIFSCPKVLLAFSIFRYICPWRGKQMYPLNSILRFEQRRCVQYRSNVKRECVQKTGLCKTNAKPITRDWLQRSDP